MSADVVVISPPGEIDLHSMSIEELRSELARSLTLSAHSLVRLAAIWRELELRGEDMADLRSGLTIYLPRIAAGEIAAEAVVAFAGRDSLLRSLSGMPLGQQRAFAAGREIEIARLARSGGVSAGITTDRMPLARMSAAEIRQVLHRGRIRHVIEQRDVLLERELAPRRSTATRRLVSVTVQLEPETADRMRAVARARGTRLPSLIRELALRALDMGDQP
ncbi:MAG: hypothetical protein ACRDI2_05295 [Chloroflexota bacterium]